MIAASLDRLASAAEAGSWSRAEQARLEAYGIFELGPEQRLRGIAPSLFQRIEGLFWYGDGDQAGLVQLVKRKDAGAELEASLAALDTELTEASRRVGTGAGSTGAVISNSAIVVFREGLEAVLILAALMASMVGGNRRFRRPLLVGVAIAFVASAVTWAVAQTVLGSLARYGEKLEAVVSVIAIAVLLLILNWFYHRVYWAEHLAGFHQRKQRLLRGAGVGLVTAQALGLAALGFSSVYREGFETVLFLQALTLEAGVLAVLPGVALGLAATLAVGGLTILLERKLPHRKMLIVTGVLMTWVLVILVGTTVQTFQVVGWLPVAPIEGLRLPVLGRHVARHLPDLAGNRRPGRRGDLRRGQLPRCGARARPAQTKSADLRRSDPLRQRSPTRISGHAPSRPRRPRTCLSLRRSRGGAVDRAPQLLARREAPARAGVAAGTGARRHPARDHGRQTARLGCQAAASPLSHDALERPARQKARS